MAERRVEVVAVHAGELRLRLLGSACEGCSGGCGGRCSLFATDDGGEFRMSAPASGHFTVGQQARLQLDDSGLRRAAWRGYGLAWLGLMIGTGLGAMIGALVGQHADLLTLVGLLAGTFAAVRFSNRHLPEPRLDAEAPDESPPIEHE
jgi:positive regulator of sigma E activity